MYKKTHSPHEKPVVGIGDDGEPRSNQNEITVKQHVIPILHSRKWVDQSGRLTLIDKATKEPCAFSPKKPESAFVVYRLWDQPTEAGLIKSTEDNFVEQLKQLKKTGQIANHSHITGYFVGLAARTWVRAKARPDDESIFQPDSNGPTQAELELAEKEQVGESVRYVPGLGGGQEAARIVVSLAINKYFISNCEVIKNTLWRLYRADGEKFVLPDSFCSLYERNLVAFPISPDFALISEKNYRGLSLTGKLTSKYLNEKFIEVSTDCFVKPPV